MTDFAFHFLWPFFWGAVSGWQLRRGWILWSAYRRLNGNHIHIAPAKYESGQYETLGGRLVSVKNMPPLYKTGDKCENIYSCYHGVLTARCPVCWPEGAIHGN